MKTKYLKAGRIKIALAVIVVVNCLCCTSISNSQPKMDRDWSQVNRYLLGSNYVENAEQIALAAPTGNGATDFQNITAAIEKARVVHSKTPGKYVIINFAAGNYVINQPILLTVNKNDSYLIFKGAAKSASGLSSTTIAFLDNSDTSKSYMFEVSGSNSYAINQIQSYNAAKNSVTLVTNGRLKVNDMIDIVLSNGSWHNNQRKPDLKNYFGQINRVKSINGNEVNLELNFADTWKFKEARNNAVLSVFKPIKYIGFENIALRYDSKATKQVGSFMKFQSSEFCWVKGVEFYKPLTSHIGIGKSFAVQISDSYFDSSHSVGGLGRGYGVAIGDRSSNCKIENNIFDGLRHSMVVSAGANNNVFGYNYSVNQTAEDNDGHALSGLGDISIHGFYPYDNLFEGNIVKLIRADEYWGGNGGNIFFRNDVMSKQIILANSRNNIVMDNLGIVQDKNKGNSLIKDNLDSGAGQSAERASLYYTTTPAFIKAANMPWPLIGLNKSNLTNIPAKVRYDKVYAKLK